MLHHGPDHRRLCLAHRFRLPLRQAPTRLADPTLRGPGLFSGRTSMLVLSSRAYQHLTDDSTLAVNSVVQQTCQQAGVSINLPGSDSSSSAPASSSAPVGSSATASSSEAASASAPASSSAPAVSSAAASYGVGASSSAPASSSSSAGAPASSSSEGADSPPSYSTPELTSALASAVGFPSTTTTTSGSGVAATTTDSTGANATSSITPFTGGAVASAHGKGTFCGVAVMVAALAFAL